MKSRPRVTWRWNAVAIWRCWIYQPLGLGAAEVANARTLVGLRFALSNRPAVGSVTRIGQPPASNDVLPWGFR